MPKLFIVSKDIDKGLLKKLEEEGEVFLLRSNPYLPEPESAHPDMQVAVINDTVFLKKGVTEELINVLSSKGIRFTVSGAEKVQKYPDCCSHNVLVCGNYLFHSIDHTDTEILKFSEETFIVPVSVKQGYAGCSSCYVDPLDLLITSDAGIRKASSKHSFNCYLIDQNVTHNIKLEGYDHGFIGGCLGYCKETNTLYVNGSLEKTIPELHELLRQAGVKVVEGSFDGLCDAGGIKCIVYK